MKKMDIINLIKYHADGNDAGFRAEAYKIAKELRNIGDIELSQYIVSMLTNTNIFVPQMVSEDFIYLNKTELINESLLLSQEINDDVIGIINAISNNIGVNKFLFEGQPGTGKTQTVKQISRILSRELYTVNFNSIIDSKLGQTAKNLEDVFREINNIAVPSKVIILFDEIDALALDRINSNDLREMGRVTSTLLKEMESLNEQIVLIATTNLFEKFDKALLRRFDSKINFNRYSEEDILEIADAILNGYINKFENISRNIRMFKKIINLANEKIYPGDLKNIIKTSIAFSDPTKEFDYLKRLLYNIRPDLKNISIQELSKYEFTLREIEILTGISKSNLSKMLMGGIDE